MNSKGKAKTNVANVARSEILAAIQRTGNNVAEVMNSLQALGAKFGINVNFTLGYKKSGESRRSGIHAEHVENGQCQTQRKLHRKPQISKISKISSRNPEEITIPELAAMVADERGINEDCALDALETAFELLEEYSLILDIGDIGILAGHEVNEVNEVNELHDDSCEAYNPCKACENFNNCGYCSWDEDEDTCEDSYDCDDFDSDKE